MGANIEFDDSDFQEKVVIFQEQIKIKTMKGVNDTAREILRLSGFEVPIQEPGGGDLQNSGIVVEATNIDAPEAEVGYNKVYAAYQHEGHFPDGSHVIVNHTNPRSKTKYLEDPIRNNLATFLNFMAGAWG